MVARGRNSPHYGFWLVHQSRTTVLDIPYIKLGSGIKPNIHDSSLLHATPAYKHRLVVKSGSNNRDIMSETDILSRKMTSHRHVGTNATFKCYSVLFEVGLSLLDRLRIALQSRSRWECTSEHRHVLISWQDLRRRRVSPRLYAALANELNVQFCYVNDRCWRWCDSLAPFLATITPGALPQTAKSTNTNRCPLNFLFDFSEYWRESGYQSTGYEVV